PARDLTTDSVTTDTDGTETVRLGQKHHGIPVLGAQYVVRMTHKNGTRTVTGTSGSYFTALDVDTTRPTLPTTTAVERAVHQVGNRLADGPRPVTGAAPSRAAATAGLTGTDRGLIVLPTGKGVLARHVTVRGTDPSTGAPVVQEVYVDAATGVLRFEAGSLRTLTAATPAAAARQSGTSPRPGKPGTPATGSAGVTGSGTLLNGTTVPLNLTKDAGTGQYLLRDTAHMADSQNHNAIQTWDASTLWWMDLDGGWPEGVVPFSMPTPKAPRELTESGAVDAHWAAGKVYEYYRGTFKRDSLDGKGMAVNSLVGVTAELGYPWVNAFWDGGKMVYGTGDDEYRSLASDLDVVGHEMTHGVVEHTADLVYAGQSGAMNEAIADYFGNVIDITASGTPMDDPDAGLIGGDLCRTLSPRECAFRDLNDGAGTGDFISMPLGSRNDQGGVHLNSHIFGGALWDLRESLGGELADRIVYKALTSYITPLDGFDEGRDAVLAAAKSLHVKGDRLAKVKKAFDAHGIVPGWEKNLGLDSDVLLGRLGTLETGIAEDIAPATGGGWWAVPRSSADSAEPYAVWTGRTDGKGKPRRVSPEDGRYHLSPVTDGKRVVWLAVGDTYDLMSAPVGGGPAQRLYSTSSTSIGGLSIDGGIVAWYENDNEGRTSVRYLKGTDAAPRTVPLNRPDAAAGDAYVRAESPSVKDGRIAYTVSGWWGDDPDHRRTVVDVYDTRTGRTGLGTPGRAVWSSRPVATSSGVYLLVDEDPFDQGQTALRRSGLDGSGGTDVIPATSAATLGAWTLTASDTAVTLTVDPISPTGTPYLDTKLYQYTSKGAALGRVSCGRGRQTHAVAGTGNRVLWLDTTTTSFDLVTRTRPAGHCG
ncbi:M4 family metallopeptidase, partial [Streptomyces sp. NPDC026673]|uniref:M4 family metallopeptidase n=1 Tax=Streptomyces sp. NPDC026673 TaxID=3155724 RepID=UPI0033C6DDE7